MLSELSGLGQNNIVLDIVKKNCDNLEEDMIDAIKKDQEDSESSSSSPTSNTRTSESEDTWTNIIQFYLMFPTVVAVMFVFCLVLYSFYELFTTVSRLLECPSYPWFYVCVSVTFLLLINYSSCKYLKFVEHPTDFRLILPLPVLCNLGMSLWGYNSQKDNCLTDTYYFEKLHRVVRYHYYFQLVCVMSGVFLYLVLCVWNKRREKSS